MIQSRLGGGGGTLSKTDPSQGHLQKVSPNLFSRKSCVQCPEMLFIRYGHALKVPLKLYKKRLRYIENWFRENKKYLLILCTFLKSDNLLIGDFRFDRAHKLMYCENYKIGYV